MIKFVPSILAADFLHLGKQLKEVELVGADQIQIDVMNGLFVPKISLGISIVEAVRRGGFHAIRSASHD